MKVERFQKTLVAQQIRSLVGTSPIMLEVGCHDGSDTAKFLEVMPEAHVYCFDCEERALIRFCNRMHGEPRVTLLEKAVADVDGERLFYASTGEAGRMKDWDYSGSLCKPTGHLTRSPEIRFKEPVPIPCIRLDTWFTYEQSALCRVDFCWADLQGSQRLFIEGARETLHLIRYLYIESHDPVAYDNEPTQAELIDELDHWFRPLATYGENILFERVE